MLVSIQLAKKKRKYYFVYVQIEISTVWTKVWALNINKLIPQYLLMELIA